MGQLRFKDALLVPSLISLSRIPLALLFTATFATPQLALIVVLIAGASDVLDGWYARRFGQVTATGAVIDGVSDKVFMATVVVTLVVAGMLGPFHALLLATRELGELPLILRWLLHRAKRRARANNPQANVVGKLCTVVQFAAVLGALFRASWLDGALVASGLVGLWAALYYWRRETRTAV